MSSKHLGLTALFTALIAVFAQIQIPLPMVPLSLCTLAIYLAALLLPYPYGFLSVLCYILLGLCGLPVFAGFQGGAAVLFSKTGGYIIGYAIMALIIKKGSASVWRLSLSCVLGTFVLYLFGSLWFMHLTGMGLGLTLSYCVLPFIPGDLIKIILAVILQKRLSPVLKFIN
jgi:Uncharacterized conserved protein